jgi:hypothetical protein
MDYVSSDYDGVLDSAEEIKIITSCLQRIPSLQNVPYKINRDEKNGKVTLSISFLSDEIGVADIERFQKLLTRDIFEHCVNYEYQICI